MTGKTHVAIGTMTTIILSEYLPYHITLPVIAAAVISSLLPDADHQNAWLNKYILPMRKKGFKTAVFIIFGCFLIALDFFYFNKPYLKIIGIFIILAGLSAHREGITHSLTGFAMVFGVLIFTAQRYKLTDIIYPFGIGYGFHLLADMFTKRGVPLLYPFRKKKYKMFFTIKVGSWWGNLFEGIIILTGLLYIIFKLPAIIDKIK